MLRLRGHSNILINQLSILQFNHVSFQFRCNYLKMTETESEKDDSETESTEFQPNKQNNKHVEKDYKKSKNQPASSNAAQKGKGKKNAKQKKQKQKNQPKKKSKSKGKVGAKVQTKTGYQENKQKVKDYMLVQNRPYNLLNVFDNLHGKIKKPQLEDILNQLSQQNELTCKQFGKNKVYFPNQTKFQVNMAQVQELGSKLTEIKQEQKELREENKKLNDDYKKLVSRKVFDELQMDSFQLISNVQKLKKKMTSLKSQGSIKIDEKIVVQIQNQAKFLDKQLSKRKKLTRQCLVIWSQIMEKKLPQVAEIMGIQLI